MRSFIIKFTGMVYTFSLAKKYKMDRTLIPTTYTQAKMEVRFSDEERAIGPEHCKEDELELRVIRRTCFRHVLVAAGIVGNYLLFLGSVLLERDLFIILLTISFILPITIIFILVLRAGRPKEPASPRLDASAIHLAIPHTTIVMEKVPEHPPIPITIMPRESPKDFHLEEPHFAQVQKP
jgi:hypothetical protein